MTAAIDDALRLFQKDVIRNGLFLAIEGRIKNPAGSRSRARSETLISAYISLTCGRFESYLQDVFFASADDLRIRIGSSNDPKIIKREKFYWTNIYSFIQWTATTGRRLDKNDLEAKIKAYAQVIAIGEIFPESFKYTNANPSSEQVAEMFRRFGVEDPFGKLSGSYRDSRGRTFPKNLLESTLKSFVNRRHQAAHHGRVANMTRADAADDDIFIRAFAQAIASVLKNHLSAIA
jgi:hypothetical protein